MSEEKRTELNQLGEFGLIESLTGSFELKHESSVFGIGDDAAVLERNEELYSLVSTDLLIEGIHFNLMYMPLKHLGYKAVAVNVSDIVAMNGTPEQITVSIAVSNRFPLEALKELYTKASTNIPVIERQMAIGENHLRPHLIHFNRCKNVLLDGFKIRESPFWTIHLYMCDGGLVRNLDVKAHGHNNDGIDFEMSRNFLVEDCSFDQGDDAVVIKAGRNQDAWRLNTPCENIVIRNCQILKGHTLLGIGSEISGGIRNIYMHDCTAPNSVMRLFFVKTNHRRGGFIENVYMKNVKAGTAQRVLEIDTEVLYQWKDLVPTYEERITRIDGIYMDKVTCESADAIYELKGNSKLPAKNVMIRDVKVGEVKEFVKKVNNVENVVEKNVTYDRKGKCPFPESSRKFHAIILV